MALFPTLSRARVMQNLQLTRSIQITVNNILENQETFVQPEAPLQPDTSTTRNETNTTVELEQDSIYVTEQELKILDEGNEKLFNGSFKVPLEDRHLSLEEKGNLMISYSRMQYLFNHRNDLVIKR
ncbi:MAG: hypothetical protein MHPSP_001057 [Paramarteilia canceri]